MSAPAPPPAPAPVLERFDRLARFYGPGRKLTQNGYPTLADARQLVELLELPDRLDPAIGSRVFRTRSAGELPWLSFTIAWAVKAGALRKQHGKLVATTSWARRPPADRQRRALQALVSLGPLAGFYAGGSTFFASFASALDTATPSLVMRLAAGPVPHRDAVADLADYLRDNYRLPALFDDGSLPRILSSDLALLWRLLAVAGLAVLPAELAAGLARDPDAGLATGPDGDAQAWDDEDLSDVVVAPSHGAWELVASLELPSTAPEVYRPCLAPGGTVHELRVTLEDVDPPIWRRLVVPSDLTLSGLHAVLQAAMGWQDCHLHEFAVGDVRYGIDYGEGFVGEELPVDERRVRLRDVAPEGSTLRYWYDFGDDWWHRVEVLAVREQGGEQALRCLEGERACPPEDCGGAHGYAGFLHALRNPRHPEHDEWRTWAGEDFDPERFDPAEADARLRELARG